MKKIDTNARLPRFLMKGKTAFFSTALALLGVAAFPEQGNAQTVFSESFSNGSLPTGWTNTSDGGTSSNVHWKFSGSPGYNATPTLNGKPAGTHAWVDASTPNTGVHAVTLTSPNIDLATITEPMVSFEWFKNHQQAGVADENQLSIEVRDITTTTWTEVFSDTSNSPNWRPMNVPLPISLAGATIQVRFIVDKDLNGNGDFYDDLLLDEVEIKQAPTCWEPSALTAGVATANSIAFSWTPPATAPGDYEYYYNTTGVAPTAATAGTLVVPTGTSATINGLNANSEYHIWVRGVCGATDKSEWSNPLIANTACGVSIAPWLYDVESATPVTNGEIEDCWTSDPVGPTTSLYRWNVDALGSTPSTNTGPSGAYSGTSYFYVEASSGSNNAEASITSPTIDVSGLTIPALKFFYHMYGASVNKLYIEASSDGTNWNALDSIVGEQQISTNDPWLSMIIPLTGYSTTVQVRFTAVRGDNFYGDLSLDNIEILEMPNCFPPTALSASAITSSGASVSWTAPTPVPGSGYEYYYNTTGVAPTPSTAASGSVGAGILTTPLSGLLANTDYTVWVRAVCSPTDKSNWSSPVSFTTLCAPFAAPFLEDFNNGSLPSCWGSTTDGSGTSANIFWKFSGSPGYGAATSYNGRPTGTYAWVDASTPNTGVHAVTLTSPSIDLTGLTTPYIQFEWFKNHSEAGNADDNELSVEVRNVNSTTWTQFFADDSNDSVWRWVGIELPASYANATIQVRFIVDKDVSGGGDFYDDLIVDNIEVKEKPICAIPTALNATNINISYATVNWTSDATADHVLEYGPSGFTPGTGTQVAVTGETNLLQSLDPNTTYDFYVQLICDDGPVDTSAYSAAGSFTTLCNEVLIPLSDTALLCFASSVILDAGSDGVGFVWSDGSTAQTLEVTAAGTYSVTVTNEFGCEGSDTVMVEALPPVVVDLGPDIAICEGAEAIVLDAGNPGSTYQWSNTAVSQTIEVSGAGVYSVVVTDINGCEGSDSVELEILPAPQVHGITAVFQQDISYNFIPVAASNVSEYLWDFGDGNTSTVESPNHTYANTGNYTVLLTVTNDCGTDTTSVRIQATGTAINQLSLDATQLNVYPNPTKHELTIENKSTFKMETIVVYNIMGQVVYEATVTDPKHHRMDVSSLSSGIYQLRIQMDEGFLSRKFEVIK